MKREKLQFILILLLLVLNAGVITYLLLQPKHTPPPGGPRQFDRMIIDRLKLDDKQQQQFDEMKRAHHEKMMQLDAQYENILKDYLAQLKEQQINTGAKDSLEKTLENIQLQKTSVTFEHFRQLKVILTPVQKPLFDSLIPELINVIVPPRKDMPPPPPERN